MDPVSFAASILSNPATLRDLGQGSIDDVLGLLDLCRQELEMGPWPVTDISSDREVRIIGDLHGDLPVARSIADKYLIGPSRIGSGPLPVFVFLGDYLDRAPNDTPEGGLLTAIFVMSLRLAYPENIVLLRGNHESADLMTFYPYDLPNEIQVRFGRDIADEMESVFLETFATFPLLARTDNGVIIAHAAFTKKGDPHEMTRSDRNGIIWTIWGNPVVQARGYLGRSMGYDFTEEDLVTFLDRTGSRCLIRGHDPPLQGIPLFGDRMITIVTSRRYEKEGKGGILLARCGPGKKIMSVRDLEIIDLARRPE